MKRKEIFWGLLFIMAAVLIILNQMGYFIGVSMFEIVATVILGAIIVESVLHLNFWGILFPMALICIIYADQWNITEFTPWPALLTATLLSIGFSMIFHRRPHHYCHWDNSFSKNVINETDGNVIDCSVSFGESIKYVNTDNLEKANISCSFGDIKVYFDHAQIPSGKAEIYVNVSFGNAVLYLPRAWKVTNSVHVFLGDTDNDNRGVELNAPEVMIHGSVSFGDVKIIYV